MGSVSLIAVTHEQKDLGTLNQDLGQRCRGPRSRAHAQGPELARKVARILAD